MSKPTSAALAIKPGQCVRLRTASRAKRLWDRAGYSATVQAGTEGVVGADALLDRDGHLTTEGVQELRGYPGTAAWEVSCFLEEPQLLSDKPVLAEVWVYVEPSALEVVDVRGPRSLPHSSEMEKRLREVEQDEAKQR